MKLSEVAGLVAKLRPPILDGLSPSELTLVLARARLLHFPTSAVITKQGQPANHLYLVLAGGARSFHVIAGGQKLHIQWLFPGAVFGGLALIARPSNYATSTEATHDTHTLVWDRDTARGLMQRFPQLSDNALTMTSSYLTLLVTTQVALSAHTARQRLAHTLLHLASSIGHSIDGKIEILIGNEDLALSASITPFTASRILQEWDRKDLIKKGRGKVVVLAPEKLLLES